MSDVMIRYKMVKVGSHEIFYREAGKQTGKNLLLLHGFPTSSHMFQNIIPRLAEHHRVIAPDLPGFGLTKSPPRDRFAYTFENLYKVIEEFTQVLNLEKFAIYFFDYGAPVGLRLAVNNPEKITALISQNGNAYLEGLSEGWIPIRAYWENPTTENRNALRAFFTLETTQWQYTHGAEDPELISPDSYLLDYYFLSRPGNDEIQLDLFLDYQSNLELYPRFQEFFRKVRKPTLAVWGQNDPFFLPEGAKAYLRDNQDAQVRFFPTGHFALATHAGEIGTEIIKFLDRVPK